MDKVGMKSVMDGRYRHEMKRTGLFWIVMDSIDLRYGPYCSGLYYALSIRFVRTTQSFFMVLSNLCFYDTSKF